MADTGRYALHERRLRAMSGQQGREVVIVEAVRTPVGRGHLEKGYYKDTHPADLLGKTYTEVLDRAGVDASEVEDVIAGCVKRFGGQASTSRATPGCRRGCRSRRPRRRSTASAARRSRP